MNRHDLRPPSSGAFATHQREPREGHRSVVCRCVVKSS